jgi:hypothetical protein
LAALAIAVEMRGDFVAASRIARTAIESAEHPSDAGGAYGILVQNLAWFSPDEAERLLENAAEWTRPLGDAAAGMIAGAGAIIACARYDYPGAASRVRGVADAGEGGVFGGPASAIAAVIHVLNDEIDEAEAILARVVFRQDRWPRYYLPLLQGIVDARRGDIAAATDKIRESVTYARRWKVPLAAPDGVIGCVALAYHAGKVERASELLACITAATGGALRSPMSMCLYRYYRREVRSVLDADTVARIRVRVDFSPEEALAAELGA